LALATGLVEPEARDINGKWAEDSQLACGHGDAEVTGVGVKTPGDERDFNSLRSEPS
jgi:hypothetical protein